MTAIPARITVLPTFLGLLSAFLFGLATPVSKMLLVELNPFLLAGLLYVGAALGVTPLLLREKNRYPITVRVATRQLGYTIGAVFSGGFLGPIFLLAGLQLTQAGSVSIWLNMELVATAVLGVLFFRDHLDRNGWAGVFLALSAGLIIAAPGDQAGWLAALWVSLACLCWGFDNHFTALIDCFTPSQITMFKGVFAGSINVLIGISLTTDYPEFSTLFTALILGSISYGASIVLYVVSARSLGATRSQILFSSAPFFGIALAVFLLQENFTTAHLLALGLLCGAIYFSHRAHHSHTHQHQEIHHTHEHSHDDGHHHHKHGEQPAGVSHSHHHVHRPATHSHPHYPDLHHRHDHGDGQPESGNRKE